MKTDTNYTESPLAEARGRPLSHVLLELIWHQGELTRADIARATGLARSTVSELVTALLDTDLIQETGESSSSGGRRGILLRFNDDARVILGVDMGASHVSVALTDLRGRTLHWTERPFPVREDPDGTCMLIEELCNEALEAHPGAHDNLLGIGVGLPAPIDSTKPGQFAEVVLPAWKGHRGLYEVGDRLGAWVLVENDANLGALAEKWWGGGVGVDAFTFIKIATGIGAGHIFNGEIFRGHTGVAGEIGHVSIDPAGPRCVCGNRGCLTMFVSSEALLGRAVALAPGYPTSPLSEGELTLDHLVAAALEDDPLALRILSEAAGHLGTVIAGLLNLMNPGAVILGGSLTRVGDRLMNPLRAAIESRTLVNSVLAAEISTSQLGERNIALGAATHVLANALATPALFEGAPPT